VTFPIIPCGICGQLAFVGALGIACHCDKHTPPAKEHRQIQHHEIQLRKVESVREFLMAECAK
jgi:hypothetical protein